MRVVSQVYDARFLYDALVCPKRPHCAIRSGGGSPSHNPSSTPSLFYRLVMLRINDNFMIAGDDFSRAGVFMQQIQAAD